MISLRREGFQRSCSVNFFLLSLRQAVWKDSGFGVFGGEGVSEYLFLPWLESTERMGFVFFFSLDAGSCPSPQAPFSLLQRVIFKAMVLLGKSMEVRSASIALSLANAVRLQPEIKLAQAPSDSEAIAVTEAWCGRRWMFGSNLPCSSLARHFLSLRHLFL